MSNRELGLLVALRSGVALTKIRNALASNHGIKAGAEALGVERKTLCRWGESWPAVAKLLSKHALTRSEISAMGGSAGKRQ